MLSTNWRLAVMLISLAVAAIGILGVASGRWEGWLLTVASAAALVASWMFFPSRSSMPVALTPAAAAELKDIIWRNFISPKRRVRISISGVAYNRDDVWSFRYDLGLDADCPASEYCLYRCRDIPLAVALRHLPLLTGAVIDFGTRDGEPGFIFQNPNPVPELAEWVAKWH